MKIFDECLLHKKKNSKYKNINLFTCKVVIDIYQNILIKHT